MPTSTQETMEGVSPSSSVAVELSDQQVTPAGLPIWVLGTKTGSSVRVAHALKHPALLQPLETAGTDGKQGERFFLYLMKLSPIPRGYRL